MRFRSSETVRMADGDSFMDIFQCEECGQLAARAETRPIAALKTPPRRHAVRV